MFRNNKEILRITTLLMAMVMIAMVVLPVAPVLAGASNPLYSEKATENINNLYTGYRNGDGEIAGNGYNELDGFMLEVIHQTGAHVLNWDYNDDTKLETFLDQKIQAVTEVEDTDPVPANHLAKLYYGTLELGKTSSATALWDMLKARYDTANNGTFGADGEYSQYVNFPAYDILVLTGKISELENPENIATYILNLQNNNGSFGDFQSTTQAARVLNSLKVVATADTLALDAAIDSALTWIKDQQKDNGSYISGDWDDPITNSAETVWMIDRLNLDEVEWKYEGTSKGAIEFLATTDYDGANIASNAWALYAFMLKGANPDTDVAGGSGEESLSTVTIRIEGPDYTILPETEVEIEGTKSYSDILVESAAELGYTVQESGGFLNSINDIPGQTYWAVAPYQDTYADGDSFVLYGGGSGNLGEITLSKTTAEPGDSFTATVKYHNGVPVEGASVIYYTADKMTSPAAIDVVTDAQGKVNLSIDSEGEYHLAAHKINTSEYPAPDNGLVRTLPKTITIEEYQEPPVPIVERIRVDIAVIDDDGEVIYGPKSVRLYSDDKFGLTALGALEETGLDYETESNNSFVTEIERIENRGLSGWMFAVNGRAPSIPAIDKEVRDGDEVLWYYSKSESSKAPNFPEEEDIEEVKEEEIDDEEPAFVIPPRRTFSDVGENILWAKDAIELLAGRGIITGTETGQFEPNRLINRAEFAKLVIETLGDKSLSQGTAMFSDVDSTKWYADYVGKAFAKGLIQGSNGNFRPMESITRNEVAVILHRMQNEAVPNNSMISFTDGTDIPDWARNAVAFSVERGLIRGYDDNTFRGEQPMTRAEVAVLLYRYIQMMNL